MQEFFPFLESKGYFCMKYEHKPSLTPHEGALGCPVQSNIMQYMVDKNGILLTDCHAYAWINGELIDVDGSIWQILNIYHVIEAFYWIGKIDLI
jgi:hypothetical protein